MNMFQAKKATLPSNSLLSPSFQKKPTLSYSSILRSGLGGPLLIKCGHWCLYSVGGVFSVLTTYKAGTTHGLEFLVFLMDLDSSNLMDDPRPDLSRSRHLSDVPSSKLEGLVSAQRCSQGRSSHKRAHPGGSSRGIGDETPSPDRVAGASLLPCCTDAPRRAVGVRGNTLRGVSGRPLTWA